MNIEKSRKHIFLYVNIYHVKYRFYAKNFPACFRNKNFLGGEVFHDFQVP